jgi:hypothetical protein
MMLLTSPIWADDLIVPPGYEIGKIEGNRVKVRDLVTGYVTPYWTQLAETPPYFNSKTVQTMVGKLITNPTPGAYCNHIQTIPQQAAGHQILNAICCNL